ncbi:MAG: hypothetical protein HC882_00840 [Acidobacteria bacterium]|nr:hypothetical protein [Acidobacteriota bacterium]
MASRKRKKPVIVMTPEVEKLMLVIEQALVAQAEKFVAGVKKSKHPLHLEDMFEINGAVWILSTFDEASLSDLIGDEVDIQWLKEGGR